MTTRTANRMIPIILVSVLLITSYCENQFYGEFTPNKQPVIILSGGPPEQTETVHKVKFSWMGDDPDGQVKFYEFVMVTGDPLGFDPADTTGLDKWTRIERTDSTFTFRADEHDTNLVIGYRKFARYHRTHTFFIRSVDNRGMRSQPACRSFTAWTLAPYVVITEPVNPRPGQTQFLSTDITFRWEAYDPIGAPQDLQPADSIRYLWTVYNNKIIDQLNKYPENFEDRWTPWISYSAKSDSGVSTRIGDNELLLKGHTYILAVQAMDEAGAITSIFNNNNVRSFMACEPTGPTLTIFETYMGAFKFQGTSFSPAKINVPEGFGLNFSWKGDASQYGSIVSGYRYGWDITSLDDPSQWASPVRPNLKSIPEKKFFSGNHTLFIEAVDQLGVRTIGQIEIEIFELDMPRNLLWVDDFRSVEFDQKLFAIPTESQHDRFWINICSRAMGFIPTLDVYDTKDHIFNPPPMELIWDYKNILWTYTSDSFSSAWHQLIEFIPENTYLKNKIYNYLPAYMQLGGHIWTVGKGDSRGGLRASIISLTPTFPLNVKCEMLRTGLGCTDSSGAESMVYKEYCVTVLDKVHGGLFKKLKDIHERGPEYDAISYIIKDRDNPVTNSIPGMPDSLKLWNEVTKPGRFFDPMERGFTYGEVYDPEYWMRASGLESQPCFNPLYRIRTRMAFSPIDNTVIAFWLTKHADVKAVAEGTVAAPSVHFGFPLWFFDREQANAIADAIFDRWNILPPAGREYGKATPD